MSSRTGAVSGSPLTLLQIPLGSALVGLSKVLYDREIAISEHRVKPASLLQDPSHILGKYEILVLPEGSVALHNTMASWAGLIALQVCASQPFK